MEPSSRLSDEQQLAADILSADTGQRDRGWEAFARGPWEQLRQWAVARYPPRSLAGRWLDDLLSDFWLKIQVAPERMFAVIEKSLGAKLRESFANHVIDFTRRPSNRALNLPEVEPLPRARPPFDLDDPETRDHLRVLLGRQGAAIRAATHASRARTLHYAQVLLLRQRFELIRDLVPFGAATTDRPGDWSPGMGEVEAWTPWTREEAATPLAQGFPALAEVWRQLVQLIESGCPAGRAEAGARLELQDLAGVIGTDRQVWDNWFRLAKAELRRNLGPERFAALFPHW